MSANFAADVLVVVLAYLVGRTLLERRTTRAVRIRLERAPGGPSASNETPPGDRVRLMVANFSREPSLM